VRGGHNTVEEISSMMGIFPAAIRASEILNIDSDLRLLWKEFLQNLSPLPQNIVEEIREIILTCFQPIRIGVKPAGV